VGYIKALFPGNSHVDHIETLKTLLVLYYIIEEMKIERLALKNPIYGAKNDAT
jgi:hypothetical protein